MVEPASRPCFFVRAALGPAGWPCFVSAFVGLAISGAVLTEKEITVGFSGLSLW